MRLIFLLFFSFASYAAIPEQCYEHPIACNIYFEARGEPTNGQLAVGYVTLNRVNHKNFGNTISDVVFAKRQFSWTHQKKLAIRNQQAWNKALSLESLVLYTHGEDDITNGALYFHHRSIRPKWANQKRKVLTIGNHIFYR